MATQVLPLRGNPATMAQRDLELIGPAAVHAALGCRSARWDARTRRRECYIAVVPAQGTSQRPTLEVHITHERDHSTEAVHRLAEA